MVLEDKTKLEWLASKFHEVYQKEARRQGDARHKDNYYDLPENIKEFKIKGIEVIEKTVADDKSSSGRIYVPKSWAGKKVSIARLE